MDMKNLVWDSSIVTILICALIMVKVLADAAYVMIGVIIMRLYLLKPQLMVGGKKISIQWKKYFHELKKELDLRIPDDYLKEFYINLNTETNVV